MKIALAHVHQHEPAYGCMAWTISVHLNEEKWETLQEPVQPSNTEFNKSKLHLLNKEASKNPVLNNGVYFFYDHTYVQERMNLLDQNNTFVGVWHQWSSKPQEGSWNWILYPCNSVISHLSDVLHARLAMFWPWLEAYVIQGHASCDDLVPVAYGLESALQDGWKAQRYLLGALGQDHCGCWLKIAPMLV